MKRILNLNVLAIISLITVGTTSCSKTEIQKEILEAAAHINVPAFPEPNMMTGKTIGIGFIPASPAGFDDYNRQHNPNIGDTYVMLVNMGIRYNVPVVCEVIDVPDNWSKTWTGGRWTNDGCQYIYTVPKKFTVIQDFERNNRGQIYVDDYGYPIVKRYVDFSSSHQ